MKLNLYVSALTKGAQYASLYFVLTCRCQHLRLSCCNHGNLRGFVLLLEEALTFIFRFCKPEHQHQQKQLYSCMFYVIIDPLGRKKHIFLVFLWPDPSFFRFGYILRFSLYESTIIIRYILYPISVSEYVCLTDRSLVILCLS